MALGTFRLETLDQGDDYSLLLSGRALPYRPITFEGTQQIEVVWYPGFPNATAQPLGPHEERSVFKGYWKDRFLGVLQAAQTPILWKGQNVYTAADAIDYADSLRRVGAQLRVTWASGEDSGVQTIQRIGFLTKLTQTWHTPHDCEWEMEFAWTGQSDAPIRSEAPTPIVYSTVSNDLAQTGNAVSRALTAATSALTAANNAYATANANVGNLVGDAIGQVANGVQALNTLSANVATTVQLPGATLSQAGGIFSGLVRSYTTVASALEDTTSTSIAGVRSLTSQPGTFVGATEQTKDFFAQIKFWETTTTYRQLARTSEGWVEQTAALAQPQPDFIYVASEGDDLRRVATGYYGDPAAWVFLAEYNGLVSSLLTSGQSIKIPPVQTPRAA
jgi:hypothetical protein